MTAHFPEALRFVDFVRIRFRLEFLEDYILTPEAALRLRRNLGQAALLGADPSNSRPLQAIFDPPLSADPVALRRYQRPSPLFVIFPPSDLPQHIDEGDPVDLEVLFWGTGIHQLGDFAVVLQALGRIGWHKGEGRFELVQMGGIDPAGRDVRIWKSGQSFCNLAPPVLSAAWWLEESGLRGPSVRLTFHSPARILTGGRPLFRPTFGSIFPFILRRVTSMVHAGCGVELLDDPSTLLEAASSAAESHNSLAWRDWRTLQGDAAHQDLGGIIGTTCLEGDGVGEILWLLDLASLMNIGKGASYGAGHFRLSEIG